jgi:hypothetical protein
LPLVVGTIVRMGFYIDACDGSDHRNFRIGTNGSGDVWLGLWLALHATSESETSHVSARCIRALSGAHRPNRTVPGTPAAAKALLDDHHEDRAWLLVDLNTAPVLLVAHRDDTALGPIGVLVDEYVRHFSTNEDGAVGPADVEKLAATLAALLPRAAGHPWEQVLTESAEVVRWAAARRVPVALS